jgi:hypothetical protein
MPSVITTRGNDTVAQCCQAPLSLLPLTPSTLLEPDQQVIPQTVVFQTWR